MSYHFLQKGKILHLVYVKDLLCGSEKGERLCYNENIFVKDILKKRTMQ